MRLMCVFIRNLGAAGVGCPRKYCDTCPVDRISIGLVTIILSYRTIRHAEPSFVFRLRCILTNVRYAPVDGNVGLNARSNTPAWYTPSAWQWQCAGTEPADRLTITWDNIARHFGHLCADQARQCMHMLRAEVWLSGYAVRSIVRVRARLQYSSSCSAREATSACLMINSDWSSWRLRTLECYCRYLTPFWPSA
jgi:hypothetical protein